MLCAKHPVSYAAVHMSLHISPLTGCPLPCPLDSASFMFSVHHQALPCCKMQMSTCSLAPHIHCTFQLFHAQVLCRDSAKLSRYPAKSAFEDFTRLVIGSPLPQISQFPCLPPLLRPSPTLPIKSMSPSPPSPSCCSPGTHMSAYVSG